MATTRECAKCGAHNPTAARRCRICTAVINAHLPEDDRGLAALRPDTGFGTSFRSGMISRPAPRPLATSDDEIGEFDDSGADRYTANPEVQRLLEHLPRITSAPPEPTDPMWEPTRNGDGDTEYELASTIVIDAAPRNGATPPPLVFDDHFDADAIELPAREDPPPPLLLDVEAFDPDLLFDANR